MEVGDMLNARSAAAADAQLRQQLQQAAQMDSRNAYTMNSAHVPVNHHRSMQQDASHIGYPPLNPSPHNHQLANENFMIGATHAGESEDIADSNSSRPAGETVVKTFACSTCQKGFARRSDLARHERIHSGHRPHSCDWPGCGKQFIQRSALTVHARVHTGEKPHMCERCGKPFSDSSSLARHRRIHSGKRPYKCPYANCQKTFTRRTTLTRHQNHHTGTIEQAAAETNAKLSNAPSATTQQQDGDYSDNASSQRSTESPAQRPASMSPANELPPIPNMHRQGSEYGYLPQSGSLPPHMRNDFSQNTPRSSPGMNSSSMSGYTSNPQHRPSLTSHPNPYGPPQPLEPPANGTASGSGSPHLTAINWGSPSHGAIPNLGVMNDFSYPDPTYGGAHPLYYPGSNLRRPQSTEPEDYGLRPRNNNSSSNNMGNTMQSSMQSNMQNQMGAHMQNSNNMGVEWSNMPVSMHNMSNMKEEKFVL